MVPRSSMLVTRRAVGADVVAAAAGEVHGDLPEGTEDFVLRPLDDGAALQVVLGDEIVLTIGRPRVISRTDELERLWPGFDVGAVELPAFWSECYTPWNAAGALGTVILDRAVRIAGGAGMHAGGERE